MQNIHRHPRSAVATPGSNAEVVVYQDSTGTANPPSKDLGSPYCWVTVAFKLDQDVTLLHKWGPTVTTLDAALVTINGPAQAGEVASAANGYFQRSIRLQPGRNRISVLAGATPPTASVIALELNSSPAIIQ